MAVSMSSTFIQSTFSMRRKPSTDPGIQTQRSSRWGNLTFMAQAADSSQKQAKLVTFLGKGNSGKTTAAVLAAKRSSRWRNLASMAEATEASQKQAKLLTFLGKGGSGKTTAAVLAAKLHAKEGLRTCLVLHSQDLTADQLVGCTIGNSPAMISEGLYAVRLQTSKMFLEPLVRMKKVDARLNLTQGVLEGVIGEELGVLPGMDSIFSLLALQQYGNFVPTLKNYSNKEFDVVIYDGSSSEDTLRLVGAIERVRWYVKHLRNLAEKTDIGRLAAPSILKLIYESVKLNTAPIEGKQALRYGLRLSKS
ncbi:hypothetical protein HPP92_003072 [Vanilla planifolia]|uniref:ArsA/GET3 Anion-transporting ATPase-like domain-containing protein n=1 Tax=Vanilla planifolia TaxID=51239 RepID=A0A835RU64_VANPL|nr:hypothetical protein HPP92_003072 [Vanilla planifolia]